MFVYSRLLFLSALCNYNQKWHISSKSRLRYLIDSIRYIARLYAIINIARNISQDIKTIAVKIESIYNSKSFICYIRDLVKLAVARGNIIIDDLLFNCFIAIL